MSGLFDDDIAAGEFDGVVQMTMREAEVRPDLALNIAGALKMATPRDYWKPERVPLHLAKRVNNWKRGGGVVAVQHKPRKITRGPIPGVPTMPASPVSPRQPVAVRPSTASARLSARRPRGRAPAAEPRVVLHRAGEAGAASDVFANVRARTPPGLKRKPPLVKTVMADVPSTPRTAARREARRLKRERKRNKQGAKGRKSTKPLHHLYGGARGPAIDASARGALESALRERRPQSALQGATRHSPQKLKRPTVGSFIDDWLPLREQSRRSPTQRDATRRLVTGRTVFDVPAPEIGLDPIAASRGGVLASRRPHSRHAAGLPKRLSDPIRFSSAMASTSESGGVNGEVAASHKDALELRAAARKAELAAAALVGAGAHATFVRMERDEKSGKWHATQSNPNLTTNWPIKVGKVAVTKVGEDDFIGLIASPRKTEGGGSTASKRESATPAGRRGTKQLGMASHGKAWGAPPACARTPAAGGRRTQNAAITMKAPPPWANKRELEAWAAHLQAVLPDQRDVLERTRSDEEEAAKLRAAEREEQRKKLRMARALTPAGARAKSSMSAQRGAIALPLHVVNSHSLAATAATSGSSKRPSSKPGARTNASPLSAVSAIPATDFTLRRDGAGEAKGDGEDEVEGNVPSASQVDDAALAEFDSQELTLRAAAETMKVELKALLAQSQAHASNPTADPDFLRKFNELSVAYRANTVRLATATQRRGTRPLTAAAKVRSPAKSGDIDAAAVEDNAANGTATIELVEGSTAAAAMDDTAVHCARVESVSSVARNEVDGDVIGDVTAEEREKPPSRAAARRAAALVYAEASDPAETVGDASDPDDDGKTESFNMRKAITVAREERIPLPSLAELKSMPTLTGLADRVRAAAMRSGTSPRNVASGATARQSRWRANSASRTTKKTQQQRELTLKRMREREAERKSAADAEAKLIAALEDGSAQRAARFAARPVPSAVTDVGRYERLLKKNAAKRMQEHAEHAAELVAQDSSFKGLEARRAQIEVRKRKRAQRQRVKQLKIDAAARGEEEGRLKRRTKLLSASSQTRTSLTDEMEQRDEERRIRIELRASDTMATSKMPARMEAHAKKVAAEKAHEARSGSAATRGGGSELSEGDRAMRKARQLEAERIMRRDALDAKSENDARKAHAAAFPDAPSFLNPESTRVKKEARRNREKKQRKQDQLRLDQKQARAEIVKRQALLEKTRRAEAEARALEAENARRHPGLARRHTTKTMEARQKALFEAQQKLAEEAAAERARLVRVHQNDRKMAVAIRHAMQEGATSSLRNAASGKSLADLHVGDSDARAGRTNMMSLSSARTLHGQKQRHIEATRRQRRTKQRAATSKRRGPEHANSSDDDLGAFAEVGKSTTWWGGREDLDDTVDDGGVFGAMDGALELMGEA